MIRDSDNPFYDDDLGLYNVQERYVKAAYLEGTIFQNDSLQVHTYITSLIAGNTKAEAAIQKYRQKMCGRANWKELIAVYQGVGAYKIEVVNAEKTIKTLFYSGEKNGHINWQNFEQRLVKAFSDLDNNTGVRVFDDISKIKLLLEKTASSIALKEISMSFKRDLGKEDANGITFQQALAEMRNEIVTHATTVPARSVSNANSTRGQRENTHPYGGRSGGRGSH